MGIKKRFYLFTPPWKKVKIYVSSNKVFKEKLLKVLAYKVLPTQYYKVRTFFFLRFIFNLLFTVKKEIPNEKIFLIYKGYESVLYFYKENDKIFILRSEDGNFTRENFLGYPIHWDFTKKEIPYKSEIEKILKTHWGLLKLDRKNIHGDFTHSNILVDERGKITVIDSQVVPKETPIIYDLFYFYSYFLYIASLYKNEAFYKVNLEEIYSNIIEDRISSYEDLNKLDPSYFHFTKDKETFEKYKEMFKDFLSRDL